MPADESTSEGKDKLPSVGLGSFQSDVVSDGNLTKSFCWTTLEVQNTFWAVKAKFHPLSNQLDCKSRFFSRTPRSDLIGPEKTFRGPQLHRNVRCSRPCPLLAQATSISWGIFPICGGINLMRGCPWRGSRVGFCFWGAIFRERVRARLLWTNCKAGNKSP